MNQDRDNELNIQNAQKQTPETEQTAVDTTPEFQFLGDPTQNKPVKRKEASLLTVLTPVISLCVIGVLLTALLIILPHFKKDNEEEAMNEATLNAISDDAGIEIFDFTGTSATRLEIKNALDEYAFVRKLEKIYYIEGKEDLPVLNSTILGALTTFGSLSAATEVEKGVTDFEQYGLDTPLSTVKWIKDDTSHYIEIGDLTPSGSAYYLRVDGGDTVYTLDSGSAMYYISPRMDYYDTTVFSFDENTDASYINEFSIYQRDGETIKVILQDLTDENVTSAFVITDPIEHDFSVEKSSEMTSVMSYLTSMTVYDDDISPENLKKYGLDDPQYTFSFTNVQKVNTAHFGNLSDEGYYYVYCEGKDFIYIADESVVTSLTYDLASYCESMSYIRSYDTIESLEIRGGGKTYNIDITGTADDGDLKAYINNKYVEYANFAELYIHILGIEITEVGEKAPEDELLVTITIDCIDGTQDVLKYYKKTDLNSFFELNGKGKLIVPTSDVEDILKFAQQLYDGEEIIVA